MKKLIVMAALAAISCSGVAAATANGGSWNASHNVLCDYWRQPNLGAVVQCYDGSAWAADLSSRGRVLTGYIHPLRPPIHARRPPDRWYTLLGGGVQCRRGPAASVLVQCRNSSHHGFQFKVHGHRTY